MNSETSSHTQAKTNAHPSYDRLRPDQSQPRGILLTRKMKHSRGKQHQSFRTSRTILNLGSNPQRFCPQQLIPLTILPLSICSHTRAPNFSSGSRVEQFSESSPKNSTISIRIWWRLFPPIKDALGELSTRALSLPLTEILPRISLSHASVVPLRQKILSPHSAATALRLKYGKHVLILPVNLFGGGFHWGVRDDIG